MTHPITNSKPTAEIIYVCNDRFPWKLVTQDKVLTEQTTELKLRRTAIARQFNIIEKEIVQENKPNLNYWMAHVA